MKEMGPARASAGKGKRAEGGLRHPVGGLWDGHPGALSFSAAQVIGGSRRTGGITSVTFVTFGQKAQKGPPSFRFGIFPVWPIRK